MKTNIASRYENYSHSLKAIQIFCKNSYVKNYLFLKQYTSIMLYFNLFLKKGLNSLI